MSDQQNPEKKRNAHVRRPGDRAEQGPGGLVLTKTVSADQLQAHMVQMKAMIDLKKQFLQDNLTAGIHNDYSKIPVYQWFSVAVLVILGGMVLYMLIDRLLWHLLPKMWLRI